MSELRPGLAAVRDLARSAQGVREAGELLDRICASVAGTFGFGRTGISRFHPETQQLELLAAHGISAEEVRQLSSRLDDWRIFKPSRLATSSSSKTSRPRGASRPASPRPTGSAACSSCRS